MISQAKPRAKITRREWQRFGDLDGKRTRGVLTLNLFEEREFWQLRQQLRTPPAGPRR